MGILSAVLILTIFMASGILVSDVLFNSEKPSVVVTLGLSLGLFEMMWLPALVSFLVGFTVFAQIAAIFLAVLIGALAYCLSQGKLNKGRLAKLFPISKNKKHKDYKLFKDDKYLIAVVLPIFLFTLYLLHTHILKPNEMGGLDCGQSTFGDMSLHLSFITSLSAQKVFPPFYNIISGNVPVGYPFLCSSISATLYTMGAPLRAAYMLPMVVAMLVVFSGCYLFFEAWLKNPKSAAFAVVLFLIGGGFGFAYFFDLLKSNPDNFTSIFTGYYTTPTNYVENNVRWVNVIADMLIPQRATLFGWSVLFPAVFILYRAAFCDETKYFISLGVLAGGLPLIHTHSFLALAMLSAAYLLRPFFVKQGGKKLSARFRGFLYYAAIAAVLALPQLIFFTFKQSSGEGFLRLHFNWANSMDNYFWFYIKNIGLMYLLIVPAFINADRDRRHVYAGGLLILLISEFIVFQPNNYDNNKLIFIWYFLSCGLVSAYLFDMFYALKASKIKGLVILAAITVAVMNTGGVLTLGREAVSNYQVFSKAHLEAADYIKNNTEPEALFLTHNNHNNTVSALTGRTIFCGAGTFLHFHGIDYRGLEAVLPDLFENPTVDKLKARGIDYVFISDYEYGNYNCNVDFFENNLERCFVNEAVAVYKVR